jgi:hypothetical protein
MIDWIQDAATHWLTAVAAVVALLSTIFQPLGALVATIWGNLGTLLPILATMQSRIAPNLDWLPAGSLNAALFLVGILYVIKLGDRLIDKYQERV